MLDNDRTFNVIKYTAKRGQFAAILILACCKLIIQTCYPQACCKLFQQVVTSLQMTSCGKPVVNRLVAT